MIPVREKKKENKINNVKEAFLKTLQQKLLAEGLKTICSINEINFLTQEQLSTIIGQDIEITSQENVLIVAQKDTPRHLQLLAEIFSGKLSNGHVVINLDSVMMKCLALMDFIPLHEMISLLIKLNPLLSKMQRLQSHFVIFNLIELYGLYESYENYSEFSQQINLYCSTCPNEDEDISKFLQKYEKWIQRLRTNPPDSIFAEMKPILSYANGSKESILNIIAEYVEQNGTKKKKSSLNVCFIAREFNRINAQFYQGGSLKEFRLKCWENKEKNQSPTLTEYSNLFNLITQFIEYLIYSYPPSSQRQGHVMTLFILIARESLHYQYGPDLTTVMAVVTIFQSPEIKKRAVALLDKNTLKILDDLTTLMSPSNDFKNYRGLLAAEPRALPFLGVIFHDKAPLYEHQELLYNNLAKLGRIYQSLLSIKKELTDVQLDSQSDLVEQLQLKRVPQKEVKVVEPMVELNKDIRRKSIPAAPRNYTVSFFNLPPEEDAEHASELSNIFDC